MEQLYNLIRSDLEAVDAVIRQRLHSDVVLVRQVAEYIISEWRQATASGTGTALGRCLLGYHRYPVDHELAAVIEFIHTATLATRRCGRRFRPAARPRDGQRPCSATPAAVLVGDFLYSRAFQMMVTVNDMRMMEVLSDATNVIAEGEVLQLMNCPRSGRRPRRPISQVIRYKTAKLFEAAGTARRGHRPAPRVAIEQAMASYGIHLGTAFQLIDDVLDYSGAELETGKHLGDDLAEGKPTLPLIFVLQNGTAEQAACVRQAIESGGRDALPEVLAAIRATGALEYATQKAKAEAERAALVLEQVPPSQYKDSLLELCLFAVARSY
jgi:octaprenyl-diphosphate synthase